MTRNSTQVLVAFVWLILVILSGCAAQVTTSPEDVAVRYLEALSSGNFLLAQRYATPALGQELGETSGGQCSELARELWSRTQWKVLRSEICEQKASVVVQLTTPDVGRLFAEAILGVEGMGEDVKDRDCDEGGILERLRTGSIPVLSTETVVSLRSETGSWLVESSSGARKKILGLLKAASADLSAERFDKATTTLTAVLEMDPNNATARLMLERMRQYRK